MPEYSDDFLNTQMLVDTTLNYAPDKVLGIFRDSINVPAGSTATATIGTGINDTTLFVGKYTIVGQTSGAVLGQEFIALSSVSAGPTVMIGMSVPNQLNLWFANTDTNPHIFEYLVYTISKPNQGIIKIPTYDPILENTFSFASELLVLSIIDQQTVTETLPTTATQDPSQTVVVYPSNSLINDFNSQGFSLQTRAYAEFNGQLFDASSVGYASGIAGAFPMTGGGTNPIGTFVTFDNLFDVNNNLELICLNYSFTTAYPVTIHQKVYPIPSFL